MDGMEDTGEVLEDLERVSRTLDQMWRTALSDGSHLAVHLCDASHGVHRAIIALSSSTDDHRVPPRECATTEG
jgi:hypothetical protein